MNITARLARGFKALSKMRLEYSSIKEATEAVQDGQKALEELEAARCCERDTDYDGNCDKHQVTRNKNEEALITEMDPTEDELEVWRMAAEAGLACDGLIVRRLIRALEYRDKTIELLRKGGA